jgi:hypothetical protein
MGAMGAIGTKEMKDMTAERLLRLYPRAWRERYGEEFLAVVSDGGLGVQQVIDIVSGAIDAWWSSDVRNATRVSNAAARGGTMSVRTMVCTKARYTTRDGVIGGSVMIVTTILLALLAMGLRQNGWTTAGEALGNSSFMIAMVVSAPFWLLKGQPRSAQMVFIGGTIVLLALISYLGFRF